MRFPTVQDILAIHDRVLDRTGGTTGLLTESAIGSAIERMIWGPFPYGPSLEARTAFLLRGIVQEHPFADGNKRTGFEAARMFLEVNGRRLSCTSKEVVDFALQVAQGLLPTLDVIRWLEDHTKDNTEAD